MMIEHAAIEAVTSLSATDIRYVSATILRGPAKGPATPGEFLAMLVYDLLRQSGFSQEPASALLARYADAFKKLGRIYGAAQPGDNVPTVLIQIMDNRYVSWSDQTNQEDDETIYDFKDLESVPQIRTPVLSLVIVLPELWTRAVGALAQLSDRSSQAAAPQSPEQA